MIHSQGPRAEKEGPTAAQASSSRSARAADAGQDPRAGMRSTTASIHSIHAFGRKGDHVASDRPSVGRRIFRGLVRFVVTVLIGVGGTLAWQSYGDAAREMAVARAPALAPWLSPTRSPIASNVASPATSLDTLRRSVEQLSARQEQMFQYVAALLAVEQDVRQKMSFMPPSTTVPALGQPAAPSQQYRSTQPRARSSAAQ